MTTIRGEVKVFRVILEIVLLKEVTQFLPGRKLDSTRTVDVDIPATSLLPVLSLLKLPDPAMGQSIVTELENLGQVGGPSANLDIAVGGAVTAARQAQGAAGQ